MSKILVCGSRTWTRADIIADVLGQFGKGHTNHLVNGGANGADSLAKDWAWKNGWIVTTYRANWEKDGRGAGPRRNQLMLDKELDGLDLIIAFRCSGVSNGTDHMCRIGREAGVEVVVIREEDL